MDDCKLSCGNYMDLASFLTVATLGTLKKHKDSAFPGSRHPMELFHPPPSSSHCSLGFCLIQVRIQPLPEGFFGAFPYQQQPRSQASSIKPEHLSPENCGYVTGGKTNDSKAYAAISATCSGLTLLYGNASSSLQSGMADGRTWLPQAELCAPRGSVSPRAAVLPWKGRHQPNLMHAAAICSSGNEEVAQIRLGELHRA